MKKIFALMALSAFATQPVFSTDRESNSFSWQAPRATSPSNPVLSMRPETEGCGIRKSNSTDSLSRSASFSDLSECFSIIPSSYKSKHGACFASINAKYELVNCYFLCQTLCKELYELNRNILSKVYDTDLFTKYLPDGEIITNIKKNKIIIINASNGQTKSIFLEDLRYKFLSLALYYNHIAQKKKQISTRRKISKKTEALIWQALADPYENACLELNCFRPGKLGAPERKPMLKNAALYLEKYEMLIRNFEEESAGFLEEFSSKIENQIITRSHNIGPSSMRGTGFSEIFDEYQNLAYLWESRLKILSSPNKITPDKETIFYLRDQEQELEGDFKSIMEKKLFALSNQLLLLQQININIEDFILSFSEKLPSLISKRKINLMIPTAKLFENTLLFFKKYKTILINIHQERLQRFYGFIGLFKLHSIDLPNQRLYLLNIIENSFSFEEEGINKNIRGLLSIMMEYKLAQYVPLVE